MSGWIDPDSPDLQLATHSAAALQTELGWAAHLGVQAVLLPPVKRPMSCARTAQLTNQVRARMHACVSRKVLRLLHFEVL